MLSDKVTGNKNLLLSSIGETPLILDGAMGSQLQARGLKPGELPEDMNILHPEWIVDIHREYLAAGASAILTNTLGMNEGYTERSRYTIPETIAAAVRNGRQAIALEEERCAREGITKNCFLLYDIGPLGRLLEPTGTLSFEDAYAEFKTQVDLIRDSVDGVIIETIADLYEMKAAVLAVKENSDLPVFAAMTFTDKGTTLMGASPETMVTFLEGIGVDALGINCSLGPKEMAPIVKRILDIAVKPVIIEPNAGLPVYSAGKTTYNVTPQEFGVYIRDFVRAGAAIVGGCCGTTPEYIRIASEKLAGEKVGSRNIRRSTRITSGSMCVKIGDKVTVCGERLNPTGKKKLKDALLNERYNEVVMEAISQEQAGADVLDVNVGIPGIDEASVMVQVVKKVQELVRLPLQIDSSDPYVLDKACRIYNGTPLINSVNGKREVMEAVFPIAKKYGGVVLCLTIDENGIPLLAEERLTIAKKIVSTAESYGIDRSDLIVDCLVLTASAQQREVIETLKALTLVREQLGVRTVLGCSNVSFGLPNRPLINRTFLAMALYAGLDLPIINPLDKELMSTVDAYEVLSYKDPDSEDYIAAHASDQTAAAPAGNSGRPDPSLLPTAQAKTLKDMVTSGMKNGIAEETAKMLLTTPALDIINRYLIPGLDEVGKKYESGQLFLPQLIQSAETTKAAFAVLKESIAASGEGGGKGPVLLATVEGDVHDIGKNIVKVVMESYGFQVIDLGKDVPAEKVAEAYLRFRPKLIGLSALMTTTVASMARTIDRLKEIDGMCPILVGGAVLTTDAAAEIRADYYARDALAAVETAQAVIR